MAKNGLKWLGVAWNKSKMAKNVNMGWQIVTEWILQGALFETLRFQKEHIWPKWVLRAVVFWKIVNKQLKNVNKFSEFEKATASQTHFGFTPMDQICTILGLQPFEIQKFQTKHPLVFSKILKMTF